MKGIFRLIALSGVYFSLHSCGGVIGNIEKYPFPNADTSALKDALNKVYSRYPELIKSDTTLYGKNNGDDFFYIMNEAGEKIVFQCNVISYAAPNDKEIDLSLTSATTWGQVMKLAPKMSSSERTKYRRLFEKNILPKIKEELRRQ